MRRFVSVLLLSCLLAAPAAAVSVGVDFDEEYDFTQSKTYGWKPGSPANNELNQKRIVSGVDDEMQARGLTLVEVGTPDLWVVTETSGEKQVKSSGGRVGLSVNKRTSFGNVGIGGSRGNKVKEVEIGTLVIAILDGQSEELVWRANASDSVTNDPEKTAKTIEKAIEKAFKKFPPKGK